MKYDLYDEEPEDVDESTQESIQRKSSAKQESDMKPSGTVAALRLLGAGIPYKSGAQ